MVAVFQSWSVCKMDCQEEENFYVYDLERSVAIEDQQKSSKNEKVEGTFYSIVNVNDKTASSWTQHELDSSQSVYSIMKEVSAKSKDAWSKLGWEGSLSTFIRLTVILRFNCSTVSLRELNFNEGDPEYGCRPIPCITNPAQPLNASPCHEMMRYQYCPQLPI